MLTVPGRQRYTVPRAALQGDTSAQYNLGVMHYNGEGTAIDRVESYAWFSVAFALGDPDAGEKRDSVAAALDAAELERGQARAAALWARISAQ